MRGFLQKISGTRRKRASWLVAVALIISVVLAVQGANAIVSLLLALLGGVFQVLAVIVASSDGKADPTLARSHVRHLSAAKGRANEARIQAEAAREVPEQSVAEWREVVGILSVQLSYIEENLVLAVEDWYDFSSDALKEVIRGGQDEQDNGQSGGSSE